MCFSSVFLSKKVKFMKSPPSTFPRSIQNLGKNRVTVLDGHFEANNIVPFPGASVHESYVYAQLIVDLKALQNNYKLLQAYVGPGVACSAVVKANAYGLGAGMCAKALYEVGCRDFFVAYLDEALDVRGMLPANSVHIYVLNGFMKGCEEEFFQYNLIPVLTDIEKVERFAYVRRAWMEKYTTSNEKEDHHFQAALHIDSGLNRTGIRFDRMDHPTLKESLKAFHVKLILGHLACSDDVINPFNEEQRKKFMKGVRALNLSYKTCLSFANSGAIALGPDYHYDMVRPGRALYGCSSSTTANVFPLNPVVCIWARIYQLQTVPAGETIGYGQHYATEKARTVATITLGYADGYPWSASFSKDQAYVMIGGQKAPVLGRVSMDLLTVDVTDIPSEYVYEGAIVDIVNNEITLNKVAEWSGTLPHEVTLRLGERLSRVYIGGA